MSVIRSLGRLSIVSLGTLLAIGVGVLLFWVIPERTPLGSLEVLFVLGIVLIGTSIASRLGRNLFPTYTVAEVEVNDAITRDGDPSRFPVRGRGVSANAVVEEIERADADGAVDALIVTLNTPGGEVVPSEDIRNAVAAFDGPTVAYAEDVAASGGYWIATGADEIHARRGSMVGSIGVNAAQLGREELGEKLGLEYRRFVAGAFKDTPSPWRALDDDEVDYFQGLLEGYYEQFVDTVVEGTDLDHAVVRETEARLYLGTKAEELGLVDACGPKSAMEDRLAERLGVDEITVERFEPHRTLPERVGTGVRSVAHAFGAGIAGYLVDDEGPSIRV